MTELQNTKQYDLEKRTLQFATNVKNFIKNLQQSLSNLEYSRQLIRSSSSVGANYIEANESLSKKDFAMRIMICRKEAKETEYWLRLVDVNGIFVGERDKLIDEVIQLRKIFGSILVKSK